MRTHAPSLARVVRVASLATVFAATLASAQTKVIRFASVVDGSGRVIPNGVVIVDGDKITRIAGPRDAVPANAQVIDLSRYTAIPGMIDLHTHMTYVWDRTSGSNRGQQPPRTLEQTAALERSNLIKTLETGVTAVRDLGASNYTDIAMRDSVNKAGWIGPRMFVAGYGLQRARPPYREGTDTTHTVRARIYNISQIAEAVKQQVDAGVDYIKMYGSTGSGANVTGDETFSAAG
jgi:imidazolonepropionase-like amidohydrolase